MGFSKNAVNESCENGEEGGGVGSREEGCGGVRGRGGGGEARKAEDPLESKVGFL